MARTKTSVRVSLTTTAGPDVTVPSDVEDTLPVTDTPHHVRQKACSKVCSKGTKIHIRGFYVVYIDDHTKTKS